MTGPYDTEAQARADVDHVGRGEALLYQHLLDACEQAGVDLGVFDRRILEWVASWEPETVQVVVGLIRRSHQAGKGEQ